MLAQRLGPLLGLAHEAHRALARDALLPLGLSPKGFGALLVLDSEGPLSQQRIAERQGVDRTTMVAVIDELEHAGAVERRRSAGDRRAYAVHVTREGRRLLGRAHAAVLDAENRFLSPLPAVEQQRLKQTLAALLSAPEVRSP